MLFRAVRLYLLKNSFFNPIYFGNWMREKYLDKYSKIYFKINIKSILDGGCGKGRYSMKLARSYPKAMVAGVDIKGHLRWRNNNLNNLKFHEKDLLKFSENKKYDLIVSVDVLEHIPGNSAVLEKFHSILNNDGVLYLAMPCKYNKKYFFSPKHFSDFEKWEAIEHIGEQYDLDELRKMLISLNFNILFSRYTFTFFGNLAWELEYVVRESKMNQKINILLMPVYKLLGWMDIILPIGKGNLLVIAQRKK